MTERNLRSVGIGEMIVSDASNYLLSAPNLGSCLGVAAYDPVAKIGGLIHLFLPLSTSNLERSKQQPCAYVDTGTVCMFNELVKRGAQVRQMVIAVAGGSNINDNNNVFEIGKKNYTVLRKVLWKNNLLIKAEHVGENFSRTVTLDIATGEVLVKVQGNIVKLI